ncbi:hypothetical protein [Geminicoccus flavidas]|uniref:hypothetical protein n=1 Tax=Geminicoccus flavidas TaxID=2506407 RepID=UPI001359132F|nr:hypothetical protein [Geminicoccus flavidas]
MGARENPQQRECWLEIGKQGGKAFRLNSGKAWAGKGQRQPDGSVIIPYPQHITVGFGYVDNTAVSGPGDLFGWLPVVITPEMVGKTVAVALSAEAKRLVGGVVSKDQRDWIELVDGDGGIAGVVRTASDVRGLIHGWFTKMMKPTAPKL